MTEPEVTRHVWKHSYSRSLDANCFAAVKMLLSKKQLDSTAGDSTISKSELTSEALFGTYHLMKRSDINKFLPFTCCDLFCCTQERDLVDQCSLCHKVQSKGFQVAT